MSIGTNAFSCQNRFSHSLRVEDLHIFGSLKCMNCELLWYFRVFLGIAGQRHVYIFFFYLKSTVEVVATSAAAIHME